MKILLLSMFLIQATLGIAQDCIVANRMQRDFYLGLENPLAVFVEGLKYKDLIVTVDNGKIEDREGHLYFIPERIGIAKFAVNKKVNGKQIEVARFEHLVKQVHPPCVDLSISGQREGQINKTMLEAQLGVAAFYDWSEWGIGCLEGVKPVLQSYRIIVMRKDSLIFSREIEGNKFTDETKEVFKTLRQGDKLHLVDVRLISYAGNKLVAKPLMLEVNTDAAGSENTSE